MDLERYVVPDLELCGVKARLVAVVKDYDRTKDEKFYYQHRHRAFELHCVELGTCTMYAGGQYYSLSEGQFCLLAPGVYHSQKSCSEPFNKFCINFELDIPAKKSEDAQRFLSSLQSAPVFTGDSAPIAPLLSLLREELQRSRFLTAEAGKALVLLIILRLARCMGADGPEPPQQRRALDVQRSFLIDEFFNDHFNQPAGEKQLADCLGVSKRQLNRILKQLYGMSFRKKLAETRMEVAFDMLLNSERTIAEISELLGYSVPTNFTAFFKTETGLLPSQFRHAHANGVLPEE